MTRTNRQISRFARANSDRCLPRAAIDGVSTECARRAIAKDLARSIDLQAGHRVLDIGAGTTSSVLASTGCLSDVTSIDVMPRRLKEGGSRTATGSHGAAVELADAVGLPFESRRFDATVSIFGVVFAEDQRRAAAELTRVTREGGRIGLASWTPDGFVGCLLSTIADVLPADIETDRLLSWGERSRIDALFGDREGRIDHRERVLTLRYRSPEHWLSVHHRRFAPLHRAFARLDCARAALLTRELLELVSRFGESRGTMMLVPVRYLECVIRT